MNISDLDTIRANDKGIFHGFSFSFEHVGPETLVLAFDDDYKKPVRIHPLDFFFEVQAGRASLIPATMALVDGILERIEDIKNTMAAGLPSYDAETKIIIAEFFGLPVSSVDLENSQYMKIKEFYSSVLRDYAHYDNASPAAYADYVAAVQSVNGNPVRQPGWLPVNLPGNCSQFVTAADFQPGMILNGYGEILSIRPMIGSPAGWQVVKFTDSRSILTFKYDVFTLLYSQPAE